MPDSSRPSRRPQSFLFDDSARRVRASVVLAALLFATLLVSGYALRVELDQADRNEMNVARQGAAAANVLVTQGIASLQGARGLVDELGYVDPDGFDAFARPLIGAPGLARVSLVRAINRGQRDLFELETGKPIVDVSRSGKTAPAPERDVYYAVERVTPRSAASTVGTDLRSDPALAATTTEALREGRTAVTAPIRLAGRRPARLCRRCAALSALRGDDDACTA